MNMQKQIDKLVLALRMRGCNYYIDTKQFYNPKTEKFCTKYIVHEGIPKNGEEFFSKVKVLNHLVSLYRLKEGDQ